MKAERLRRLPEVTELGFKAKIPSPKDMSPNTLYHLPGLSLQATARLLCSAPLVSVSPPGSFCVPKITGRLGNTGALGLLGCTCRLGHASRLAWGCPSRVHFMLHPGKLHGHPARPGQTHTNDPSDSPCPSSLDGPKLLGKVTHIVFSFL